MPRTSFLDRDARILAALGESVSRAVQRGGCLCVLGGQGYSEQRDTEQFEVVCPPDHLERVEEQLPAGPRIILQVADESQVHRPRGNLELVIVLRKEADGVFDASAGGT